MVRGGCGDENCGLSISLSEALTFGQGHCDANGYWQFPCHKCARAWEDNHPEDKPCWPFVWTQKFLIKETKVPFLKLILPLG